MESCVEINLIDSEFNKEYKLMLSPADAHKAQNDLTFATSLLNFARQSNTQHENEINAVAEDCPIPSTSKENKSSEWTEVDGFRWSHAAVMLLIEEYRQKEQHMSSGKISHKKSWDQIASKLNSMGHVVTGKQCNTRMTTMKRTYKAVKDHNGKSGNSNRTWEYFDIMDSLFGGKPYMAPLSTASSTAAETFRVPLAELPPNSPVCSDSTCSSPDGLNQRGHRKRKFSDLFHIAEERREKRHKERMEMKVKLLEKLDLLIDKFNE